jgi:NADH-quinone oxidoreductase subunit H
LLAGLAAVGLAAVPLAPGLEIADIEAGIVLFGAAMLQVMVAVFLHGWSANSVFPLIGAYRFAALALSFGIPFSLVIITTAIPAESLAVGEIIRSQQGIWNVVRQPLGLPVYLATALGFAFWGPFRLPDGADLAGGTEAEVSGAARLAWHLARAAVLVSLAAMGAAVFLGGHLGPWLPGWGWTAVKTIALLTLMVWIGHRLPRVRTEWVVQTGWVVLLPVALADVFVSGALAL